MLATVGKRVKRDSSRLRIVGDVRIWDADTGTELATLEGHKATVTDLAFSPDGKILATAGSGCDEEGFDNTVRLWDVATGKSRLVLGPFRGSVTSIAFSPSGTILGAGIGSNGDRIPPGIADIGKLWDPHTGKELTTFRADLVSNRYSSGLNSYAVQVAFLPGDKTVVTSLSSGHSATATKYWDVANGKEIAQDNALKGHISSFSFSQDGRLMACGHRDGRATLWRFGQAEALYTVRVEAGPCPAVALNSEGRMLAVAHGASVRLSDHGIWPSSPAYDRLCWTLKGHILPITCLAFSPDNRSLATADFDGTVKVWNCDTARELTRLKGVITYVNRVAFGPDAQTLVTATGNGSVELWDANSGRRRFVVVKPDRGTSNSSYFTPIRPDFSVF